MALRRLPALTAQPAVAPANSHPHGDNFLGHGAFVQTVGAAWPPAAA
ncbi:hypothetical protein [Rubrivivax rivuli]|nr:hypothetical protein [Rubrivivax rivuli]